MKIITQVTPGHEGKKLPVDIIPQVYLSLPLNTIYELPPSKFELRTNKTCITIKSLKTDFMYPFTYSVNESGDLIDIKPSDLFRAFDSIELIVKVDVFKNGVYQTSEVERSVFTTGQGYNTIPLANIESSYPIDGMANYYKDEYNQYKGFIQLKSGMPELFYNLPEGTTQKIRLTKVGGEPKLYDYSYDGINARISFPMDPAMLENDKEYTLEIVRISASSATIVVPSKGVDIKNQASNLNYSNLMGIVQTSNPGESSNEETVIAQLNFRVSKYNTLKSKLSNAILTQASGSTPRVFKIQNENFDNVESNILMELKLEEDTWLQKYKTNMYEFFPKDLEYAGSWYGGTCNKTIQFFFQQGSFESLINQLDFHGIPTFTSGTGGFNAVANSPGMIRCDIAQTLLRDYNEVKTTIERRFGSGGCTHTLASPPLTYFNKNYLMPVSMQFFFRDTEIPPINPYMGVILEYRIPGIGATSSNWFTFY